VDKGKVVSILTAYSPPLALDQINAIAEEISKVSAAEIKAAVKKAKRAKPSRES